INRTIRFGHWKDNAFVLKGDGVWNYTFMFLQLWTYSAPKEYQVTDFSGYMPTVSFQGRGFVQIFGDSPLDEIKVAENAYMHVINMAKRYVWISTPYLILDSSMINALTMTAQSGVDVRIITPSIPDKKMVYAITKANYRRLLANGVKIYEYAPGFIHSKMFLSDDDVSIVGTTNMDYRSFFLHFESGSIFYGGDMIGEVKSDFLDTFNLCHEVTYKEFQSRPIVLKLLAILFRIAAPLL
ncbi:MAG: cardiolipin synthase, partial [Spirochaetales bacterium]|nr:cardiolipin synthase [Spirochaetales bacterium]